MLHRDGGNHSSLAQLLKDLEKRAEGGAAPTEAVGSTISRPLHVVLQVSNVTWNFSSFQSQNVYFDSKPSFLH